MSKRISGILGNRAVRRRVFERFGHKCCNCGSEENLRVDHIVGIKNGGNDVESNLCILCWQCHYMKHILEKSSEGMSERIKEGKAISTKVDGRPRNTPDNYKELLNEFIYCRINRQELAERWGLQTTSRTGERIPVNFVHLSEQVWYREYLDELGIQKVVNKVGRNTRDFYSKGIVGYIVYKTGVKRYIYHNQPLEQAQ